MKTDENQKTSVNPKSAKNKIKVIKLNKITSKDSKNIKIPFILKINDEEQLKYIPLSFEDDEILNLSLYADQPYMDYYNQWY